MSQQFIQSLQRIYLDLCILLNTKDGVRIIRYFSTMDWRRISMLFYLKWRCWSFYYWLREIVSRCWFFGIMIVFPRLIRSPVLGIVSLYLEAVNELITWICWTGMLRSCLDEWSVGFQSSIGFRWWKQFKLRRSQLVEDYFWCMVRRVAGQESVDFNCYQYTNGREFSPRIWDKL
jgi:hypothetical protein